MRGRKIVASVLVVVMVLGLGAALTLAQPAGMARGGEGRGPGGRGGRGGFDPAQMRQQFMQGIQERVGVSAEEWSVLQPKLEKVMTLQAETRGGGMRGMMMRGRRGGRGREDQARPDDGNAPAQPQSAVQKAYQGLQETLENESASAEEVKTKLTVLRKAREKAKQELAKAQESLRELLTQRQEAHFVLMGFLE